MIFGAQRPNRSGTTEPTLPVTVTAIVALSTGRTASHLNCCNMCRSTTRSRFRGLRSRTSQAGRAGCRSRLTRSGCSAHPVAPRVRSSRRKSIRPRARCWHAIHGASPSQAVSPLPILAADRRPGRRTAASFSAATVGLRHPRRLSERLLCLGQPELASIPARRCSATWISARVRRSKSSRSSDNRGRPKTRGR